MVLSLHFLAAGTQCIWAVSYQTGLILQEHTGTLSMALDLMAHSHAPCAEQASTWMSAPTHNCGGPDPPSLDQATKLH